LRGVLFGCGAMLGQAVGYVFSKIGMLTETGYLDAFAATQVRVITPSAAFFSFLRSVVNGVLSGLPQMTEWPWLLRQLVLPLGRF
jgi:hypothetical protein